MYIGAYTNFLYSPVLSAYTIRANIHCRALQLHGMLNTDTQSALIPVTSTLTPCIFFNSKRKSSL